MADPLPLLPQQAVEVHVDCQDGRVRFRTVIGETEGSVSCVTPAVAREIARALCAKAQECDGIVTVVRTENA